MLVRLAEGCRELGVSTEHGRRMIRNKKWPCYQLGTKALRIDIEEIRELARLTAQASSQLSETAIRA